MLSQIKALKRQLGKVETRVKKIKERKREQRIIREMARDFERLGRVKHKKKKKEAPGKALIVAKKKEKEAWTCWLSE